MHSKRTSIFNFRDTSRAEYLYVKQNPYLQYLQKYRT